MKRLLGNRAGFSVVAWGLVLAILFSTFSPLAQPETSQAQAGGFSCNDSLVQDTFRSTAEDLANVGYDSRNGSNNFETYLSKTLKLSSFPIGLRNRPACVDSFINKLKNSGEMQRLTRKAQNVIDGQDEERDRERFGEQERILKRVTSKAKMREVFGIEGGADEADIDGSVKGGFLPRGNTLERLKRFGPGRRTVNGETAHSQGNPYIVWTKNDHTTPQKIGGHPVRFVLSGANFRTSSGVEEAAGNSKGIVWIFRNEYNPSLTMILWSRDAALDVVGGDDFDRLSFSGTCEGVTGKSNKVATLHTGEIQVFGRDRGGLFPNDPEDDLVKEEYLPTYNLDEDNGDDFCDTNTGIFAETLKKVMKSIKEAISAFMDWIKDALLNVVDIGTLTDNRGLTNAWKTMRDFVNVIFILVMVAIAFSNILRIDTDRYGVRALLPRLIFGVIAVNFSFILVQILTNVAYIVSQPFISKAFELLQNPPATGGVIDTADVGQFLITIVLALLVLIGFIILFAFFVLRILIIWFLAALSPFVFLFMVLPITRSLASQWWQNALKWIFAAPIAFVLLFIAAELIGTPSGGEEDVNGPDFLLKVAFFLLAAIAAVMIPIQLGGKVASQAYRGSKAAGRYGGKYGGKGAGGVLAGTVGRISPGGTSLATRARATGYGLGLKKPKSYTEGSRGDLRQKAAFAHLEEQTGQGKGVGRLTGATPGQRTIAQQRAIGRYQKEMATVTPAGKRRIAWAHGNESLGAGSEVFDGEGNSLGLLTADEADFATKRQASEAAFAELSQAGLATHDLSEAYAGSGLQQLNVSDPAQAAIDRNEKYRQGTADAKVQFASPDDMKKWDHSTYLQAAVDHAEGKAGANTDYHRTAAQSLAKLDKTRAGYAVTRGHRNSMPQDQQRELMQRFAKAGGFDDSDANKAVLKSHDQDNPDFT